MADENVKIGIQIDTEQFDRAMKDVLGKIKDIKAATGGITSGSGDLQNASKNIGGLAQSWKSVAAGVFTGTAAYNAFMEVGRRVLDFTKESIRLAMEEEKDQSKLFNAVGKNTDAYVRMNEIKNKLIETTTFSKDEIDNAIAMGLQLGRTEEQTKKLIDAAMGLSKVTGQDLNSSMMQLSATYEGQVGRLGKVASEVKTLTKEQLVNGEAIDIINKKFGKFATEGLETASGSADQFGKSMEELQITVGSKFLSSINNAYKGMTNLIKSTNEWISGGMVEATKKEQVALNDLVIEIMSYNEGTTERNDLINKLRLQYPEFLGDLKNEQATNEALNKSLIAVNNQYLIKIRNIQNEKVITDLAEKQVEAFDKQTVARQKFTDALTRSLPLMYQANSAAARLIENEPDIAKKMELIQKSYGGIGGTGAKVLAFFSDYKKAAAEAMNTTNDVAENSFNVAKTTIQDNLNLIGNLEQIPENVLKIAQTGYRKIIKGLSPKELLEPDKQEISKILSSMVF